MSGRLLSHIGCSAFLVCTVLTFAQPAKADVQSVDPRHFDATSYGDRIVLGPMWLFAPGDNDGWAAPGSDDREWMTISSEKELADYGVRNLSRAWYRIHVHLPAGVHSLMVGTRGVAGRYEVYANGVRLGALGTIPGSRTVQQNAMLAFAVPDNLIAQRQDLVLAIRVALNSTGDKGQGTSTPLHPYSVFLIGRDAAAIAASYYAAHGVGTTLLSCGLALVVCLISCALYFALRTDHEYLVIAILLLAASIHAALVAWMNLHVILTLPYVVMYVVLAMENFSLIELVRLVLHLRRTRWLLALEVVSSAAFLLRSTEILQIFSPYVYLVGFFAPVLAVKIVLPWLLFRGAQRGNWEALLLFPAIFMGCFADYWNFLRQAAYLGHLTALYPYLGFYVSFGSYTVDLWRLGDFAFHIALLLFLVLRTVRIARERAVASAELEAARSVQQVLIPEEIPSVPGFQIQSVYRPAGQVGGDFFQILPLKGGGLLALIGDVSGKGMPAAMTVSLLVGTVRTLAHYTQNPGEILAAMNQRMIGRSNGGFTTCLVLRADPDGRLTASNAGHITPLVNGNECKIENGLPLGLDSGAIYPETSFELLPGSQLTLLTDGVVEARGSAGELFGFDRAAAISTQSAESIASTAQSFGQEDDITVVTLSHTLAPSIV